MKSSLKELISSSVGRKSSVFKVAKSPIGLSIGNPSKFMRCRTPITYKLILKFKFVAICAIISFLFATDLLLNFKLK